MVPFIRQAPDFDAPSHTYRWDGQIKLSVTQVLDMAGLKCQFFRPEQHYRDRGTAVHFACELLDQDQLAIEEYFAYDAELPEKRQAGGYLRAYMRFIRECSPEVIYTEKLLYSPHYDVCGTLDRFVRLAGVQGVLDIKTGSLPSSTAVQVAGYGCLLYDGVPPAGLGRWGLQLKSSGKYRLVPYHLAQDSTQHYSQFNDAVQRCMEMATR